MKNNLIARLLLQTERSVANWRSEGRPIIKLLDLSFSDQEIESFLTNEIIPVSTLTNHSIYPILKRSIKMRVIDFSQNQFFTSAFQRYINRVAKEIAPILTQHQTGEALERIFKSMDSIDFSKKIIQDPIVSMTMKEKIVDRIKSFFEDFTNEELNFICAHPYEFSEITHSTFSIIDRLLIGGVEKPIKE